MKEIKDKKADQKTVDGIDEYKKQLDTYVNDLKRLQADFENYKKRIDKENHEFREYCNKELLMELLTLMDDFEHSINNFDKASKEDLEKTLKMLHSKLKCLLEKNHVRSFKSLNEKFDPFKHEALLREESDKDNIVLGELQKGYCYKDRILRHAKVKISRKGEKINEKNQENKQ